MFDPKTITLTVTLAFAVGCVGSVDAPDDSADQPNPEEPAPEPDPGQSQPPAFMDLDFNSLYDAVDRNRDSQPDYQFAESAVVNALIDAGICLDPALLFVDANGDGSIDAIDIDCDGTPDVSLTPQGGGNGGGGGGGLPPIPTAGECTALVALDGDTKRVDCSSDATGTTCACYRNDVLVDSCSQPGPATCSVTNGCCDFGG